MSQRNTGVPLQVTDPDACAANLMAEACTVRQVLDHVGGKWSISILLAAIAGPVRFSQLERMVEGISRRMLTLTLRNLERDGAIRMTPHPVHGRVLQWTLTRRGLTLLDKCRKPAMALERRLAAGLSPQAQTTVRRRLARIAADLQQ